MHSRGLVALTRGVTAALALAGIVLVYSRWLHVNSTTVALTLLLVILILAARWSLRYAVAFSLAATICWNYFFLPPLYTFTIADPQNWVALFAFVTTAVIGSRLAQRARDEAHEARTRQRELEVLFRLSRELLMTENVAALLNTLPATVASVTSARSAVVFLLEKDRYYRAGLAPSGALEPAELRQLALTLSAPEVTRAQAQIPLRVGVRPRGLLLLEGASLSDESLAAVGGLVSIAIDRAHALEDVARNEATKESDRLRTLMTDSITHELRTPLTSIKGAATTLLLDDAIDVPTRRELLGIIDEESDRLNRLVSESVEMAQLDAQQIHMNFARHRVAELIQSARENSSGVEPGHSIAVDVPDALHVRADITFLEKVLRHLLENAAKYSAAGTGILVSAKRESDRIAISIADHGRGIDDSEQALIFDRFYRARNSAATSGTGMGLAISRAIVQAHGGEISVVSQPSRGSVFTVILPAS